MVQVTSRNFSSLTYEEKFESIKNELKGEVHLYKEMASRLAAMGVYFAKRPLSEGGEWKWWMVTDNGVVYICSYASVYRSRKALQWIAPFPKYDFDLHKRVPQEPKITFEHYDIVSKYIRGTYSAKDVAKAMGWELPKVHRQVHKHDRLWSYLKNAQDWSDAAKHGGIYHDYCQKEADKVCPYRCTRTWDNALQEVKEECYQRKQEYLDKAIKRAVKIGVKVVYDTHEECLYFETENGQCSFHDFRSSAHFSNLGAELCENYKWSGLRNTCDIIYNAVGKAVN